jgi:CRISPR-associated protein Csd1
MILQALSELYHRLVAQGVAGIAPHGYSPEKISYEILLATDGEVLAVNDIRNTLGKKPQPAILEVPQPEKRTVGIRPNFLWDKTSYTLGVSNTSKRVDQEHAAFKALHETALAGTKDAGLQALLAFLRRWLPEQFQPPMFSGEMLDANMVFRFDDEKGKRGYLHNREAARTLRAHLLAANGETVAKTRDESICLVSGESTTIARLHPAVKGVSGAQSSGAALVSFNLDAFTSYGRSQGDNAPISEQAAFAYTTALNHLLRRDASNRQRLQVMGIVDAKKKKKWRHGAKDRRRRIHVGDATVVFWAEAATPERAEDAEEFWASAMELPFGDMLDDAPDDASEAEYIRHILEEVLNGRPLEKLDPELSSDTRMFVLGLAPNASRLSVRFWQVDTLEVFARRLAWYHKDLRLEPFPQKIGLSVWRLAQATAPSRDGRARNDDVPSQLAGELMRAILTGHRYPTSLLANLVMRMRSDGDISSVRVALCKAVLARDLRIQGFKEEEEKLVSLNKQSTKPGYLLGRLFAVMESAQRNALGKQINATIRDRYYGAASATPASIFSVLLRNTQNHLSKLRKEKPGLAVILEKEIREIVDGLPDTFPASLNIQAQGQFAIGYYHQAQTKRVGNGGNSAAGEDETNQGE